jgi:cysteinyl-tRNA synthetase
VFDTIVRWLRRDHAVTYVRNFTDVDDKIIKRANERGEDPIALAGRFADAFHDDMAALGVGKADVEPRVSTHMQEIIDFIGVLEQKGVAYRVPSSSSVESAGDDVYYRLSKFPSDRYLQLSGRSVDDMMAGARVAIDERKEDPGDFALWKSAKPDEPYWESPFGRGRPGWHIECSAMSKKHLGTTFDIHGGGKDLMFPHHTNEIAQSEAAHDGVEMARYWLHNGFVNVDDEKMSKSLGNFFTIRDVLARFTPEALRMLILGTHYRGPIAFADVLVEEAEKRVQRLYETKRRVTQYLAKNASEDGPSLEFTFSQAGAPFVPWQDFTDGMNDDFNTPKAIAALTEVLKVQNLLMDGKEQELIGKKLKPAIRALLLKESGHIVEQMCAVLGVGGAEPGAFLELQRELRMKTRGIAIEQVQALLEQRRLAKVDKNYAAADAARDALMKLGIEVRDTPDGVDWTL